jgi:PAS domain S-box-containing protein
MELNAETALHQNPEQAFLRGSEELRLVIDTIPVLAWCHRVDGSSEFFNQRWHDYTGLSADEAHGWGWTKTIHADDLPRLLGVWEELRAAVKGGGVEARLRRFDGAYRWFLFQAQPFCDDTGNLLKWYGANTEIDDRKQAESLLSGENQILELIATGGTLAEILRGVCRLVDEFLEGAIAAILLLEDDEKHLRLEAGAELPAAFVAGYVSMEIGPQVGSCGTAAYLKEQVIASDIATDPRWACCRELALDSGLRAGWATPVVSADGSLIGIFSIYWREPRSPTAQHQRIIKVLTHLTGVAIERQRASEAVRASERFARGQTETLTHALEAMVRESSADRIAEQVMRTVVRQLDAHSSGLWLKNQTTGLMGIEFTIENGQFGTKADSIISAISPPLRIDETGPWQEVFRTAIPVVVEDIRECQEFPWREHLLAQGVLASLLVPMKMASEVTGILGVLFARKRSLRAEEIDLAQALANHAMLALKLTSLSAQSRQAAVIEERNRMARDIHDTLAQGFTGVIVQLEAAGEATAQHREATAADHLEQAAEIARESLREARRSVQALRPLALEEKSLGGALKDLIGKMTAGTKIRTTFTLEGEPRELSPEWEANLLRIGQEALTNVLRHAQASEFQAQIVFEDAVIRMSLRDNGKGFDPGGKYEGCGLQGMKERAESMGGQLTFQSVEGIGTVLSMTLPIAPALDAERL